MIQTQRDWRGPHAEGRWEELMDKQHKSLLCSMADKQVCCSPAGKVQSRFKTGEQVYSHKDDNHHYTSIITTICVHHDTVKLQVSGLHWIKTQQNYS